MIENLMCSKKLLKLVHAFLRNSIRFDEGAILFMKETKVIQEQNISKKLTESTCNGYKSKSRPVDGFELIRWWEKVIGNPYGNR